MFAFFKIFLSKRSVSQTKIQCFNILVLFACFALWVLLGFFVVGFWVFFVWFLVFGFFYHGTTETLV